MTKFTLLTALGLGATAVGTMHQADSVHAATRIDNTHLRVQAGDTLYKIAQENHTSVDKLAQLNHLSNPALIHVGDVISLDGSGQTAATANAQNANAQVTNNNANIAASANTTTAQQSAQASNGNTTAYASTSANYAANYSNNNLSNYSSNYSSNVTGDEASAKEWIAQRESGGSYGARNGQYVGRYQLSSSYLNGDYSPANQERVAQQYMQQRYGSWQAAKNHWLSNGWW